jgi:hypothetical protein
MHKRVPVFADGAVPIPNRLFDEVLPEVSDTELRVLLVVLRATLGWREGDDRGGWRYKRRDWISHAQFMKRTGRGSEAVSRAIHRLVARSLLVVEDTQGKPLATTAERRGHVGRLYFRPVDMWITGSPCHPVKPKTTTYTLHNKRESISFKAKGPENRTGLQSVRTILHP